VPTTPDAAADFFSQYFRHCLASGAASHPQEIIEVMNEVEAHLFDCTGAWGEVGAQQVVDINVAIADRLHAGKGVASWGNGVASWSSSCLLVRLTDMFDIFPPLLLF
jgi:hypothetical protein